MSFSIYFLLALACICLKFSSYLIDQIQNLQFNSKKQETLQFSKHPTLFGSKPTIKPPILSVKKYGHNWKKDFLSGAEIIVRPNSKTLIMMNRNKDGENLLLNASEKIEKKRTNFAKCVKNCLTLTKSNYSKSDSGKTAGIVDKNLCARLLLVKFSFIFSYRNNSNKSTISSKPKTIENNIFSESNSKIKLSH